jgi:hypothetical protein
MEDMAVHSKIMLFSPIEEVLQVQMLLHWRISCRLEFTLTKISCWSPNFYHTCRHIHDVVEDYRRLFNRICNKMRHITSFI